MANRQASSGVANYSDLKKRLVFLLGALIVFRIGAHIPVPGVDAAALAKLYESAGGGILNMLNMFSGGSLERFSVFAIGIMPYISASIIVQLASEIMPSLKALKKEGEAGRRIITKYTRYGTVLLASLQSFGVASFVYSQNIVVAPKFEFFTSTVFCLVGGTMFLMWLGEQMTERGIGNGISLIITAGIAAGLPSGAIRLWTLLQQNSIGVPVAIAMWFFIMHDYQKQRILTFLDPESDPLGTGWNIIQSKAAIGSGGVFGKGYFTVRAFLLKRQPLPEQGVRVDILNNIFNPQLCHGFVFCRCRILDRTLYLLDEIIIGTVKDYF